MFPKHCLLFLLLALGTVHASPVRRDTGKATLKISRKVNPAGFSNLVENERARIQAFKQLPHLGGRGINKRSVSVTNAATYYTAEVGIGTPPTSYTLLIDTGSSNTWVGAGSSYASTNSSQNTGNPVSVIYGSASFYGREWLDTLTLTADMVVRRQSIGVASFAYGADGIDGIFGLGPIDLTNGTVANVSTVPTVMDNLYAQNMISKQVLGIFFSPASQRSGGLTFGGYDDSVTTSPVNYVPLTTTLPASYYWGINQSISYGGTPILSSTSGIVDTGTTLIFIATDAFQKYRSMTGATLDIDTSLLIISPTQYANLKPLSFNIGGTPYDLVPNAQIFPRALNNALGGSSSLIYLVVNDIGSEDVSPFGFVNGYTFLERFYSIYDTSNQRFGIAKTIYTDSNTN